MNTDRKTSFSDSLPLFHGGPLARLMERIGFGGCSRPQVLRRIILWVAIVWLPPLVLAAIGYLSSQLAPQVTLLHDFSFHVRCLVAIPILVAAECYVQTRLSDVIPLLVSRELIRPESKPALGRLEVHIQGLQGSILVELSLLLLSIAFVATRSYIDLPQEILSWKTLSSAPYTLAREWNDWIGLTVYYFFLLRWAWRYLLWCWFLIRVANLKPEIQGLHPDQMGGLSFLIPRSLKFGLIFLALSSVVSSNIAMTVIYGGESIDSFWLPLVVYLAVVEITLLIPLLPFTPLLARAKRTALTQYGNFGYRHAKSFSLKWFTPENTRLDPIGVPEISSLNDLGESYDRVTGMRLLLMTRKSFVNLAAFTALPLLPLLILKIPLLEMFTLIAKAIA